MGWRVDILSLLNLWVFVVQSCALLTASMFVSAINVVKLCCFLEKWIYLRIFVPKKLNHTMAQHNITGQQGENLAAQYLINKGYRIVARNWHNRGRKELDIVAEDGHTLVFVEVKTRRDGSLSSSLGAVTPAKMYRLSLAANSFIRCHQVTMNVRFDIIGIVGQDIVHVENAFVPPATYY